MHQVPLRIGCLWKAPYSCHTSLHSAVTSHCGLVPHGSEPFCHKVWCCFVMLQDFGAVLEASMGWTKLLTELLQELGPVNVRGASQALDQTTDNLHDELCTG